MIRSFSLPRRLSFLLSLVTFGAAVILLVTVALVANSLAKNFDADARRDVEQRVERGAMTMIERLQQTGYDYSIWTAAYEAVISQDIDWIEDNILSGAFVGGTAHLIAVGGGPLESIVGQAVPEILPNGEVNFESIHSYAREIYENEASRHFDGALTRFTWIDGQLWLIFVNEIVPHTETIQFTRPTALIVMGVSFEFEKHRHFGDTLLLSDVRVQVEPGEPGASFELLGPDGPAAWLTWAPPKPGTGAIVSAAVPVGVSLGLVMVAFFLAAVAMRKLALNLEVALVEARAANRAKSAFLANMSHEIRTPLNGVLGMADILADTPLKKNQRDMLTTIRESGWSLLSLINDILDLSRVESGKLALEPRPFTLIPMIERLQSLHGASAYAKGITLEIVQDTGLDQFRFGDENRIGQILHNIIGNSVKFTEKGGVTLVVQTDAADEIVFRLRDTGVGMTQEQISRVFEPFEQADAGTSRRFGGTGLGMSIVRHLVDTMNGDITLTSEPGVGTEVTVRLPVPVAEPIPDLRSALTCEACSDTARNDRLDGFRLLVAEDNPSNRKILALLLEKLNIQAVFATNGVEACDAWKAQDFDLVLLDISMPIMDGLDALKAMQRDSEARGRPMPRAIAATANVMKEQTQIYKSKGFIDILPKPVRSAELKRILLRHLMNADGQGRDGAVNDDRLRVKQ